MANARSIREQKVDWLYTYWEGSWERCIYCNALATGPDHVPPLVYAEKLFAISKNKVYETDLIKVPSCPECNKLAGALNHATVKERQDYLRGRLKQRYRSFIEVPKWSDDEIREMGFHLKGFIKCNEMKANEIRRRIFYIDSQCESYDNIIRGIRPKITIKNEDMWIDPLEAMGITI